MSHMGEEKKSTLQLTEKKFNIVKCGHSSLQACPSDLAAGEQLSCVTSTATLARLKIG